MRPFLAGAAAAFTLTACLHLPPPRPVHGGERIELDEVTVRLPAEPGWSVRDVQVGGERSVSLFHAGPAGVDRQLDVVQTAGTPSLAAPLGDARGVSLRPLAADPAAAGPRFGPLSARLAFRAEPAGRATPGGGALFTTWVFAVPPRLDRGYRATYVEREPPPAGDGPFTTEAAGARAEAAFDALALRPPGEPRPVATPPDLLVRTAMRLAVGAGQLRLLGATAVGLDELFSIALERSEPARGRGLAWDLGVRAASGTRSGNGIAAVLLEPGVTLAWGPARLRIAPDVGLGVRQERATVTTRQRAVLGGATTLGVDVHHGERVDLFVEAGASMGTERFSSLGLRLGVSLH